MEAKSRIDVGGLLSARERIHSAVSRSSALVTTSPRTRRIAADLTYVTGNPETWEFSVGLLQFANEEGRPPAQLFKELHLEEAQQEPSPSLIRFVDRCADTPWFDRDALLHGAYTIARSGMSDWNLGRVVVTTLEVCESLCGDDFDCIMECMTSRMSVDSEEDDG